MTVKTGTSWAGTFVTLDSTGALSAATTGPAGTLYVDGTANGATVTITGSNPYKWSVTLPSLTAGQRVDMYITATISTIATAGFVASEQADTALVSEVKADAAAILADTGMDGVKIASAQTVATVTNLTNLPTMPTDWVTAAGLKADAVAEIADGVWDEAIAGHVAAGSFGAKNQKVVPSETIDDYKADVSAITGAALSAAGVDAILDEVVVGSYTMRQLLAVMASALAGKLSGGGTTTLTFRGVDDTSDVIVATVDASHNRTNTVLTV